MDFSFTYLMHPLVGAIIGYITNWIAVKMLFRPSKAIYIGNFDKIVSYLKENAKSHDLILTLGAGTITELGPMILQ